MQKLIDNILILWAIVGCVAPVLVGCADNPEIMANEDVECCVKWEWSNGRAEDGTRAITSLLETVNNQDLEIEPEEYPDEIALSCNNKDFTLTKGSSLTACSSHNGFYNGYTCEPDLTVSDAEKGVTATAKIDGGKDELYGETTDVVLDGSHLKITLHHRKALIRFAFRIDSRYAKIRFIHVKKIVLKEEGSDDEGIPVTLKEGGLILGSGNTTSYSCAGYCYVDSTTFQITQKLQFACTYDIYDKDADFTTTPAVDNTAHLTRKDIVAANQLQLSNLMFSGGSVTQLKAGYYYDLCITLNPEYLYVLSDHDNKHITIE